MDDSLERRRLALEMRRSGKTLREIGEHFGVGKKRTSAMCQQAGSDERKVADSAFAGLSMNAIRALKSEGLQSKSDVRSLIEQDSKGLWKVCGVGDVTHAEIMNWLQAKD